MNLWEWHQARATRRMLRHEFLVERGLDNRSLARVTFERLDPRLFIAFTIIGLFAWAFAETDDRDAKNLMIGALIAAFAGAWGYYLGSSNSANQANDRAARAVELGHDALRALPAAEPAGEAEEERRP